MPRVSRSAWRRRASYPASFTTSRAGFPRIGAAQALLASGRASEAVRSLEAAQARHPDDDDVRALLGLALRVARRGAHERRVLAPLLAGTGVRDTSAARLAHRLAALAPDAHP